MRSPTAQSESMLKAVPAALTSINPLQWLTLFGPGAIIASLTIGTGELIFSSRGGAIFGYRVLFLFLVILVFKWVLVFSAARYMVLTGQHPLRRWLDLPFGPRGWLPCVLFVFATLCIPIWVSFHASVIGALISDLTKTKQVFQGASSYGWGILILLGVLAIALRGGYLALEKIQLIVVAVMLLTVSLALLLLKPDWQEMLLGAIWPQPLSFPDWMLHDSRAEVQKIVARPVWMEASLYVGVIGGSSYDYLAYTSFLRDKRWGLAGSSEDATSFEREDPVALRQWLRAPWIDCSLSFLVVFVFSAVFVASGSLVLGPAQQIPVEGNFLEHQSQFVTRLHPWLFPLYVVGALLAMLGTLYGTLEIAPVILREAWQLLWPRYRVAISPQRIRLIGLLWPALGALALLGLGFVSQAFSGTAQQFGLTTFLIPANLFTGVLSCGLICLLNPWMSAKLPAQLRPSVTSNGLNLVAGSVFLFLGLKGYWDFGGGLALLILFGTIAVGCLVAVALQPVILAPDSDPPAFSSKNSNV